MQRRAKAALSLAAAVIAAVASGFAWAAEVSDAQALAIVQKHCGPCHARNPTHPAFDKPPKNIVLETAADLKKNAARVLEQVEDRTMPLGNETDMTDEDRETLGRWVNALK
jgi:uncharacterized membrane protein